MTALRNQPARRVAAAKEPPEPAWLPLADQHTKWLRSENETRPSRRSTTLVKAINWINNQPIGNRDLASLCRHVHVSERTLERYFKYQFGLSPREYWEEGRLHEAFIKLKEADPEESTVGDILNEMQYSNHGRTAARYRNLFGETPKQTLGYR